MVVKRGSPFVEPSRMPRIRKLKMLQVEMVAVFVERRVKKSPERSVVFFTGVRIVSLDPGGFPFRGGASVNMSNDLILTIVLAFQWIPYFASRKLHRAGG